LALFRNKVILQMAYKFLKKNQLFPPDIDNIIISFILPPERYAKKSLQYVLSIYHLQSYKNCKYNDCLRYFKYGKMPMHKFYFDCNINTYIRMRAVYGIGLHINEKIKHLIMLINEKFYKLYGNPINYTFGFRKELQDTVNKFNR
jgi:hypothetical protein